MMSDDVVEILLVEDNPNDEELTLHAFRKYHLTNRLQVVRDGEEALDFIFCRGAFASATVILGGCLLPFVGTMPTPELKVALVGVVAASGSTI